MCHCNSAWNMLKWPIKNVCGYKSAPFSHKSWGAGLVRERNKAIRRGACVSEPSIPCPIHYQLCGQMWHTLIRAASSSRLPHHHPRMARGRAPARPPAQYPRRLPGDTLTAPFTFSAASPVIATQSGCLGQMCRLWWDGLTF